MRNIDSSQWLESPKLNEIKATNVGNKRVSEFILDLQLKRAQAATAGAKDAAGKPPAPAAKKG
jgi:Tfp pilus assembly protein PilN